MKIPRNQMKLAYLIASVVLLSLVAALSVGVTMLVSQATAQPPPPKQKQIEAPSPERLLPLEERKAAERKIMEDFYAKQSQFSQEFIANGRDFHSLPVVEFNTQDSGPETLDETINLSVAGIRGIVTNQRLSPNGGSIVSEIRVLEKLHGEPIPEVILVAQPGAPRLNDNVPVLVQTTQSPIL